MLNLDFSLGVRLCCLSVLLSCCAVVLYTVAEAVLLRFH